jgi:hypothetical protein
VLGILRRAFSFSDWTRHHPAEPPPGDMLDATFDAQNSRIAELEQLVLGVLRSDGRLQNQIVSLDSLAPDFLLDFDRILAQSIKETADLVRIPAENAIKSGLSAVLGAEDAKMAAAQAEIARNAIWQAKTQVFGAISDLDLRIRQLQTLVDQAEARWVTDNQDWDDAASEAQAWSESSRLWAEHMPDTLPDNALKVMDVTGDHWSSRWWANQAANAFGMLTSLYLGAHPLPPTTNNNGGPIQIGSIYYDTTTGQAMVWDGSQWVSFYGVERAGLATRWYLATAGQTAFPLTSADLHGATYTMNATTPEGIDPHVNGIKLMPLASGSSEGDFTVNAATSTITFLRPLRAGDMVGIDILMPVEALGPGNVNSWKLAPITPNGSTVTFALSTASGSGPPVTVQRNEELIVSVDGAVQEPTASYSATGASITFVTPPAADSKVFITWLQSAGGSSGGGGMPSFPPSDGGEYVFVNGAWRLKSQSFILDGLATIVVPVPAGARMVRMVGSAYPLVGNGITAHIAVSGTTMIMSNYSWGGASFNTGTDQTLIYSETAGSSAMFITGTANMTDFPHTFSAEMNLVRANTSKTFSLKSHGICHSNLPNRLLRTALFNNWLPAGETAALSLTAFELVSGTTFGPGSMLEVSWVY